MILGTHNSATSSKLVWWQYPLSWIIDLFCKCQSKSIQQQLEDGIRIFNLQVTYYQGEWVISHGLAIYDCTLIDVVSTIRKYSDEHDIPIYLTIGEDNCFFTKKEPELLRDLVLSLLDRLFLSKVDILHFKCDTCSVYHHYLPTIHENYWYRPTSSGITKWIPIPRLWAYFRPKLNVKDNEYCMVDFYEID